MSRDDRERESREAQSREVQSGEVQSREVLARLGGEGGGAGESALARAARRAGDHLSARDAHGQAEGGGTDPVELWGRRIGRGLSIVGAIVLAYLLGVQLRLW